MPLRGKKLLYFFDAKDWDSRFSLARAARKQGAQVRIGLIGGTSEHTDKDPEIKIIPVHKKQGGSKSIAESLRMLREIKSIIAQEKPDIIHTVTLKYSLITALAAITNRPAQKIFTIAGLGYLYRSEGLKSTLLRNALWPLLVFAFRQKNTHLIFQNADDRARLIDIYIATVRGSHLIKGSGVYLDRFEPPEETSREEETPLVLMPTRLVHEKGVAVFIEAARILKNKGIDALFEIAGGLTHDNPRAITEKQMREMTADGAVTWLGRIDNMPEKLKEAAMIVYPSYYGEGLARVLLEGCAAGRPIITTDHPGCREAVEPGRNGLLVPVRNPQETAKAIESLLADPARRQEMGRKSREKAENEFDIHEITRQTLEVYRHI